ncbi:unnamed protein product [Phytophthora fragariaefolia]|uniref:Unnamed protein product n=1 Tax=Phytophthora fragariaefolia TaxID=1490495 RepID=A0A9W6UCB0_9STRA|nr:unnamed protein product [Phytophthora fragariaefolia]
MQLLLVEIDVTAQCDFNDVLSSTSDQEFAPLHSFAWHRGRETAGQRELAFRPFSPIPETTSTSTSTMPSSPSAPHRTKNITTAQRQRIIAGRLQLTSDGILAKGADRAVAAANGIHPSTVSRLWSRAKEETKLMGQYVAMSRMNLTGRRIVDRSEELERLRGVPVASRSTVRSAASAFGVPPTTLHRRIKAWQLRNVTSVVKPLLTEANRQARLQFCVCHVYAATLLFSDMLNMVYIDEKIFYVTQPTRQYLLLPGEVAPTRRVNSKRYITRVMVLAAVARPRFNATAF